ncbi:hypothetical protein vseg_020001 [Gypsophila vaccaria]
MQTFVTHFVFIIALTVVSLVQFPSPILVDARKLTSNNAVFSVDLIRRNTSSIRSLSHHHRIIRSSKLYDNSNVQTEIISDGGYYAMKFSMGTPPVEFTAVPDTGSDLVWVQCSPCQDCLSQRTPLFDPTKSSTDTKIDCTSQACDNSKLGLAATGCTDDKVCAYLAGYGDGTASTGELNTETVTFTSPTTSFPNIMFGCGYDQEGSLGPDADGIVGLGGGPLSLVSQLGPIINHKFSYCLTSPASEANAKLNFGLDVTGPGVISTPYSRGTQPTFYYLNLDSISIGDTSVPVAQNIVIDSGTTLTILPSDVYNGVKAAVQASIGVSPVADPAQNLDLCYDARSLSRSGPNPPDVVFNFSGANVVLKPENTFILFDNGVVCLAMTSSDDTFIFGNVAQINFHIGYDLQANQVSFAPQDCSIF